MYQWETLVEWLDSEGMAKDLTEKKWLDEAERQKNIEHIIRVLEKWTRVHYVKELVETGQLMHFPWASVASIPELLNNPQLAERGFLVEAVDKTTGRSFKFPGTPVKMGRSPWQAGTGIPGAGKYNREVYQNRLGLTETEISDLKNEGVI
jgi:crotonobetainyl-CoA:carnitine CoA-transferase CaiB-like acyl-CoA transferase